MLYSEDVPSRIVYDFQYYCGVGDIEKLKNYLPSVGGFAAWFLSFDENDNFISNEEYPFAFWYGLEAAAGSNKIEVVDFILEHPMLKKYKKKKHIEKIRCRYGQKLELCPNNMCESASDPTEYIFFNAPVVHEINISDCLEVAATKGYFELFNRIASTDIKKVLDIDKILMKCFSQLDENIFTRLKKVENISDLINKNMPSVLRNVVLGENRYALNVLKNYFKIKASGLENYFDSDFYQENKRFISYAELELGINSRSTFKKVIKI